MDRALIKNRKDQKLSVVIQQPTTAVGLAFVMHGLGGFKEQPHIEVMAQAFLDNGFTVVRFDTTNSFGESDGQYEDASVTSAYEDLEYLIDWSRAQDWYQEPFVLAGHSLGGLCVALYAQKYPTRVSALAPISTVVSGALTFSAGHYAQELPAWRESGWLISESKSKPGLIKRLKFAFHDDALKYDLLPGVDQLTMPVLLAVGDRDESTTPEQEKLLYDLLPGPKELHLIKNADHNFRQPGNLDELSRVINQWLTGLTVK